MRYNLCFNQYGFLKYQEKNPHSKINILDAIILNWIYVTILEWKDLQSIEKNGLTFHWIAYNKFIEELPGIGISTKDGFYRRLKNGLIKEKLLQKFIDKKDNNKTYFRLTTIGLTTVTIRATLRNAIGQNYQLDTDDNPNNNNTIYNNTKDERELTHIDFLITYYSKEFKQWQNENERKIFNKREFKEAFNNDMMGEGTKKNDKLLYRFKKYARNWIKRQNPSDIPEPTPPYLRRCT